MKTMSCRQLGGACDKEFHAETFEEMAELSKQHGMEMYQRQDPAHLEANKWFESKRQEFKDLPERSI
jgi:predicted component of type VI protein secretion system